MGGKWLKFLLCGRMALRPWLALIFVLVLLLNCILCSVSNVAVKWHVQGDGWPPWSNKWCDAFRDVCVRAVAELAQLPHPIKYGCSVWAVFLFSGDVWALWIIRSKQDHEFWRTRVTPACTRPPRSGVIHQRSRCLKAPDETQPIYRPPRTHTQTHLCSCTPACTSPAHSCKAWNYSCGRWHSLFRQMTHTQHLVNASLAVSCVPLFLEDILFRQPLLLLHAVSVAASLRQHLHARYHLMTVPSPCSRCNEVSE